MGQIPYILKKRFQFLLVAKSRRKWITRGFIIQTRVRCEDRDTELTSDLPRVGYTVTKKIGNAVIRNRVKRRLRAAVAQVFPSHALSGNDYVLIGRRPALDIQFKSLTSDLEWALQKLNLKADL